MGEKEVGVVYGFSRSDQALIPTDYLEPQAILRRLDW